MELQSHRVSNRKHTVKSECTHFIREMAMTAKAAPRNDIGRERPRLLLSDDGRIPS